MLKKGLVIYQPRGRAGEYAPLAVNLYRGCGHGCIYCFAPDTLFIDREQFKNAQPRAGIIQKLEKDAPIASATYDGEDRRVLLCFTCDPYQPINDIYGLARQAIKILHANGFAVTILTKGGHRANHDFDLYTPGDEFAATLTFLARGTSRKWEPQAAIPIERIETLRYAHDLGIRTWVSLEPVIEPVESLEIIRQTHEFVDLYKLGILNHHPQALEIDWGRYGREAVALVESFGKELYIKDDLKKYL